MDRMSRVSEPKSSSTLGFSSFTPDQNSAAPFSSPGRLQGQNTWVPPGCLSSMSMRTMTFRRSSSGTPVRSSPRPKYVQSTSGRGGRGRRFLSASQLSGQLSTGSAPGVTRRSAPQACAAGRAAGLAAAGIRAAGAGLFCGAAVFPAGALLCPSLTSCTAEGAPLLCNGAPPPAGTEGAAFSSGLRRSSRTRSSLSRSSAESPALIHGRVMTDDPIMRTASAPSR